MMNTRDLQYLVALSQHKHFGKAADACFVSQPALSMQIRKLEESLGVKLLERNNKSVLLTDTGLAITERARSILNQIDELRDLAKSSKDPFSGELKLGIIPTLAPYLLPLIVGPLSKKFPRVSFYLHEQQTAVLLEKLKTGQLDAAFLVHPVNQQKLSSSLLFEEEFMLTVSATHKLAKRKFIKQQDLDSQDLFLLEEGHCMRDQTLALCHKMNAAESQHFRATSLETLRHMVAAGNGMTLMPKLAQQANASVVYVPFQAPKPVRTIGLYWRVDAAKIVLLQELAQQVKKILDKHKSVTVV